MEGGRGLVEDAGEVGAESAGGDRAVADELVDVARVEPGGAGPGVQFASVGHGHLEPGAIGGFELPRAAGGGLAAGRRSRTGRKRPVVAAIQGFDTDEVVETAGHRAEPGARLLQHGAGIVALAAGHDGCDK